MSLTFWDTVRGHELADTLIRHLPQLAKRKEQYTIIVMEDELEECIETELKKGHLYVTHVPVNRPSIPHYMIIFEK